MTVPIRLAMVGAWEEHAFTQDSPERAVWRALCGLPVVEIHIHDSTELTMPTCTQCADPWLKAVIEWGETEHAGLAARFGGVRGFADGSD